MLRVTRKDLPYLVEAKSIGAWLAASVPVAFVSDYLRLEILEARAAVYFDTDVVTFNNLDSVMNQHVSESVQ